MVEYKERNKKKRFTGKSLIKDIVMLGAGIGLVGSLYGVSQIVPKEIYSIKARDMKTLKTNRCEVVSKLATELDESQQYTGIARRIIRSDDNINIGKEIGIERFSNYISEMNKHKKILKGKKYATFSCGGLNK